MHRQQFRVFSRFIYTKLKDQMHGTEIKPPVPDYLLHCTAHLYHTRVQQHTGNLNFKLFYHRFAQNIY